MTVRFGSWYAQSLVSRTGYNVVIGNPFSMVKSKILESFKKKGGYTNSKDKNILDLSSPRGRVGLSRPKVFTKKDQMRLF